jgi:hypothetical protein
MANADTNSRFVGEYMKASEVMNEYKSGQQLTGPGQIIEALKSTPLLPLDAAEKILRGEGK